MLLGVSEIDLIHQPDDVGPVHRDLPYSKSFIEKFEKNISLHLQTSSMNHGSNRGDRYETVFITDAIKDCLYNIFLFKKIRSRLL